MGHRLALKAQDKLVQDQVAHQHRHDDGDESGDQPEILEHDGVTDAAHHAQAGALGQDAHHDSHYQSQQDGGGHGAGAALTEHDEAGGDQHQSQQSHHQHREHQALGHGLLVGTAEAESLLQEHDADEDADNKAHQTNNGIEVAAADTDDHAQGAAQEHQGADHHEHSDNKAGHGGGAALGTELLADHGDDGGAQHQADDLGTDVLHDAGAYLGVKAGPLEIQGAGDVPQEAGDAEAHVGRVTEGGQQHRRRAYYQAGDDEQTILLDEAVFFHISLPHSLFGGDTRPPLATNAIRSTPETGKKYTGRALLYIYFVYCIYMENISPCDKKSNPGFLSLCPPLTSCQG